ncbi:hypothetical protein M407DRAFT_158910 [Tulasnella calospora MUT 4182]|uniref:Uncharacterized protein n=1 Tax=Tulasnella calospora MUT 4182 TaxID=1051891 RepID=A0A0C3Q5R8_9AGAM|nr:hypothetical protein M407DRAFT_158910 [Tulasnella calospora MUT 4182]
MSWSQTVWDVINNCWRVWNKRVHWTIRWAVYGALAGLAVYLILGFATGGIAAGSLAAAIHSMLGNVAAGSAFSIMQSLGATGMLAAIMPLLGAGGAIGIRGAVKSV